MTKSGRIKEVLALEKVLTRPQLQQEHFSQGNRDREDWEKALNRLIARGDVGGIRDNRLLMQSRIIRSAH